MAPAPSFTLSDALRDRLLEATRQCASCARSVNDVVAEEGRRLREREFDDFEELVRRKTERLAELEEADRHWRAVYAETGLPQGPAGVRPLMRRADNALEQAWNELTAELEQLQAMNEANGRLIHRNLEHNRRLLEIFFQGDGASPSMTYGTDGSHEAGERRREITRA